MIGGLLFTDDLCFPTKNKWMVMRFGVLLVCQCLEEGVACELVLVVSGCQPFIV